MMKRFINTRRRRIAGITSVCTVVTHPLILPLLFPGGGLEVNHLTAQYFPQSQRFLTCDSSPRSAVFTQTCLNSAIRILFVQYLLYQGKTVHHCQCFLESLTLVYANVWHLKLCKTPEKLQQRQKYWVESTLKWVTVHIHMNLLLLHYC